MGEEWTHKDPVSTRALVLVFSGLTEHIQTLSIAKSVRSTDVGRTAPREGGEGGEEDQDGAS